MLIDSEKYFAICKKQISVEGNGHFCHRPSSNWETKHTESRSFRTSATICTLTVPVQILDKGGERHQLPVITVSLNSNYYIIDIIMDSSALKVTYLHKQIDYLKLT